MIPDRVGVGAVALPVKVKPGPLEGFVLFGHPSGTSRNLMARKWKAENLP